MQINNVEISTFDLLILIGTLFIIYAFMYPQLQIRASRRRRLSRIKDMEDKWGSKVLTMIHRKEAISLLGLPVYQFIDVEDAEEILRGIREAKERPVDLIMHTPGGQLHASIQIARALKNHKARTRVFVPHYSMSGGTIIALAAQEIVMDRDASLGPIDPQIGDLLRGVFPAPAWVHVAEKKGLQAEDTTLVISDISQRALDFMRGVARELLDEKFADKDKLNQVIEKLIGGLMVHSQPISASEAKELGLPVSTELPNEVHEFMKLYKAVRSNVEYLR